jgi:hypothetical protein
MFSARRNGAYCFIGTPDHCASPIVAVPFFYCRNKSKIFLRQITAIIRGGLVPARAWLPSQLLWLVHAERLSEKLDVLSIPIRRGGCEQTVFMFVAIQQIA